MKRFLAFIVVLCLLPVSGLADLEADFDNILLYYGIWASDYGIPDVSREDFEVQVDGERTTYVIDPPTGLQIGFTVRNGTFSFAFVRRGMEDNLGDFLATSATAALSFMGDNAEASIYGNLMLGYLDLRKSGETQRLFMKNYIAGFSLQNDGYQFLIMATN